MPKVFVPKVFVLVVAAGRGQRFGGEIPKQYLDLNGRMVLRHSLATFCSDPSIARVCCVIHPDDRNLYDLATSGLDLLPAVHGGSTRQESVRLGLEALASYGPDFVLIHDGARPLVDRALVARIIHALKEELGAIPALPVADTLKRGVSGRISGTQDRSGLFRAQTPQGFRYQHILEAHRRLAGKELTDDAALMEECGDPVALVPGDERNIKVTTVADLDGLRHRHLHGTETRFGSGYDVHRFVPGTGLWLCGIFVPHDQASLGHSDADVGLHAATDALLGSISAGDIGHHFPPTDPRWKGAASHLFLTHAANLIAARGGKIINLDITLICERPKIGPHRPAMQAKIAQILGISPDRVSVKATTTEGLGFTGRKEGIAAQAVACVQLPCP